MRSFFFLWKGLQVRRREGTGQRETKAQPAQASTSTTEDPNPVNPNRKRAHLEAKRTLDPKWTRVDTNHQGYCRMLIICFLPF